MTHTQTHTQTDTEHHPNLSSPTQKALRAKICMRSSVKRRTARRSAITSTNFFNQDISIQETPPPSDQNPAKPRGGFPGEGSVAQIWTISEPLSRRFPLRNRRFRTLKMPKFSGLRPAFPLRNRHFGIPFGQNLRSPKIRLSKTRGVSWIGGGVPIMICHAAIRVRSGSFFAFRVKRKVFDKE